VSPRCFPDCAQDTRRRRAPAYGVPEDLADAMKFVAALHPRTSVTELVMYPTFPKTYSPEETGLPS